ncbi:MAG TPA: DRTGG domain-containing protein [Smithellaceae bacterium]|nr:DRTGG domain-containing protein [Smithellaceae bacterium]
MKVKTIAENLGLKVVCGSNALDRDVTGGYTGDLLSDVMANSKEGTIWITRQVHQNIVAVASLKEHAAIILINDSQPTQETLEKAETESVPILVSNLPAFELSGKVFNLLSCR